MPETPGHSTRLEAIGSAAAGIAHDLNNQLTLILNHLEQPDVDAAREATRRCSALTAALLSYCKGEAPVLRPLRVGPFLRAFFEGGHIPPRIQLAMDIPEALPDIRADPVALTRVLANLVANACHAMCGAGVLHVRATRGIISLSDTGPGIPAGAVERIFNPFFSTKGASGSGLGLAIVKQVMLAHGGSVTVESSPGRGAKFTLRFRTC
ncbi:MAG TPA: HAMP domain-containing sensor histidine kinase [Bryobacteraceae bacterium]|nr:HAMP domain-containing sensor histidine kinase [Bryobacteraceae bacterium]